MTKVQVFFQSFRPLRRIFDKFVISYVIKSKEQGIKTLKHPSIHPATYLCPGWGQHSKHRPSDLPLYYSIPKPAKACDLSCMSWVCSRRPPGRTCPPQRYPEASQLSFQYEGAAAAPHWAPRQSRRCAQQKHKEWQRSRIPTLYNGRCCDLVASGFLSFYKYNSYAEFLPEWQHLLFRKQLQ